MKNIEQGTWGIGLFTINETKKFILISQGPNLCSFGNSNFNRRYIGVGVSDTMPLATGMKIG